MPVPRSWTIGSDPACDVVVDRPTVSGRHCRVERTEKGLVLEDTDSSNGTYVNGEYISRPVLITERDAITLGQSTPFPWPAIRSLVAASAPKPVEVIRVGRDSGNDVVLDFPSVSGNHAELRQEGSGWIVADLGSTNGTAVNSPDRRIGRATVELTDVIYFGGQPVSMKELIHRRGGGPGGTIAIKSPEMTTTAENAKTSHSPMLMMAGAVVAIAAVAIIGIAIVASRQASKSDPAVPPNNVEISIAKSGAVPIQAVSKPPSPSTTATKLPSSPPSETILKSTENGVVWLGFQADEITLPLASGWAIEPALVITTGHVANLLSQQREKKRKLVAWQQGEFHNISEVAWHPRYKPNQPGEIESLRHNVGFARLGTPARGVCSRRADDSLHSLTQDTPLAAIGFVNSERERQQFDPLKFVIRRRTLSLASSDQSPNAPTIFHLSEEIEREMEGAPMIDGEGKVVGVLAPAKGQSRMITVAALNGLLK